MAEQSFEPSDSWLLLSIIYASKTPPITITNIIAAADYINHCILSYEELASALKRLAAGGLVKIIKSVPYPHEMLLTTYYLNTKETTEVRKELAFIGGLLNNTDWLSLVASAAVPQEAESDFVDEGSFQKAVESYQKRLISKGTKNKKHGA